MYVCEYSTPHISPKASHIPLYSSMYPAACSGEAKAFARGLHRSGNDMEKVAILQVGFRD